MAKFLVVALCTLVLLAGSVSPSPALEPMKTPLNPNETLILEAMSQDASIDAIAAGQDVETALLVIGLLILLGVAVAVGVSG